jgi:hypothetical protein
MTLVELKFKEILERVTQTIPGAREALQKCANPEEFRVEGFVIRGTRYPTTMFQRRPDHSTERLSWEEFGKVFVRFARWWNRQPIQYL